MKRHVHCYDEWPTGVAHACTDAELEPDGEVLHEGVRYKPVLVFDRTDCLVMQRDFTRAFVVTPADGVDFPSQETVKALMDATASA